MEAAFFVCVYAWEEKTPDMWMSHIFTFLLGEFEQFENHCCFLVKEEFGVLCVCLFVMQQVSGGATGKGNLFNILLPQMIIAPMQQDQKTTVQEISYSFHPRVDQWYWFKHLYKVSVILLYILLLTQDTLGPCIGHHISQTKNI